ncbi:hypothetical protein [Anaeromyxobacter paludicola]|uniref:Uncharacterized protein n=1 Tax=Anaeromyxobacter paludicola TaxID=2918171 RepID=A0ABM7XD18_9BACT|nr:hypothetical protein [Anaeromyxobacter paludicola]BDG09768.1 hypothetical protein AMPC_28810 [Anaeromyxobacter paludicola]
MAEYENKLVDKRVVARYIKKGVVDEKDYEQLLKKLPDLADQAVPVEAAMDLDDFDDEEEESPAAEGPEA